MEATAQAGPTSNSVKPVRAVRFGLFLLKAYRYLLSPFLGQHCRFHPSCSRFAEEALVEHGAWRGCWLAFRRLLRCHPWHQGGFDPVPPMNPKQ